ncbi:hypothetical protein BFW01_g9312 [Lasiodiplodia theobromae]|nr:hypothetical protein BFW01_g9312 [Lasiodiplodia theobromae]
MSASDDDNPPASTSFEDRLPWPPTSGEPFDVWPQELHPPAPALNEESSPLSPVPSDLSDFVNWGELCYSSWILVWQLP